MKVIENFQYEIEVEPGLILVLTNEQIAQCVQRLKQDAEKWRLHKKAQEAINANPNPSS